ncbi:dynein light intermediate chain [Dictyocaulus viviparus]|uniref:Dynein light intermediate chain n=1 Tax=Dictyocaulus viviparus TaxID=29172 RepID=A0A0D8XC14_DICVI|nr:dynein light intermediate chain [Dictyocaulus viviparus]
MVATELSMGFSLPNVGSSVASTNAQTQEDEKLWTRILSEVSSKSSSTLQGGTLIILGEIINQESHHCWLVLKKNENQGERSALDYHFLNVQNDFRDGSYAYQLGTAGALGPAENLSLPVWILDGEECFAPLLQYALPMPSPAKAVVLLVASLDNPSEVSSQTIFCLNIGHTFFLGLIHSIRRWANIFTQQVIQKYDKAAITEAKAQQERFWQEYVEPVESSMASSMAPGALDDGGLLPLEHGVLSENCGASFMVVITKSDLCTDLSDQQADRILVQVRRLCLQLGAALIYTSAKNMLYKYVVHRAFGFPFTNTAQLIERDSLFVPAGWDGEKKLRLLGFVLHFLNKREWYYFEGITDVDAVSESTREKSTIAREQLVEAEDEQAFLQRLAATENAPPAAHKKASLLDDAADNKTPLSSFFSNLLKVDKPNVKTSVPPPDTAVQLDRILKSATGQQSQNGNESSA